MNAGCQRLYVVDDDEDILTALADYLGRHGFLVSTANDGGTLDRLLAIDGAPDMVILDIMMPGEDGLTICRRLSGRGLPVLLLSALGDTTDRIVGLETGAADYLPKPFEPRELLARVRAVLRRPQPDFVPEHTIAFEFAGWRFEANERRLSRPDGLNVALTPGEARLLAALVGRPGRLFSRDMLMNQVRGADADAYDRSIDLLVSRLRRKLADHGLTAAIETVRGEGYRLDLSRAAS